MNSDTTNSRQRGNDLTQRFALDVQGFDELSAQAKASPQAGMKMAAQQFDAVFTQMMLKSMRDATPQDGPFDSHDSATFTSMMDQQLSQQLSQKGIGVADAMLKQMMRNQGMQGAARMARAAASPVRWAASSGGDEGQSAALNALAKAYGNAQANGQLAMGKGYIGQQRADAAAARRRQLAEGRCVRRQTRRAGAGRQRGDRHSGALHHRSGRARIGLGQERDQEVGRLDQPQRVRHQGDQGLDRQDRLDGHHRICERQAAAKWWKNSVRTTRTRKR